MHAAQREVQSILPLLQSSDSGSCSFGQRLVARAVLRYSSPCTVRMPDPEKATFHSPSAISGTEQRILETYSDLARRDTKMPDEEWIKTLEDGRKVKFIYQVLPEDGAFITAQIARNEIVYSVVLTKAGNPLSREDVESHFEGELSKK